MKRRKGVVFLKTKPRRRKTTDLSQWTLTVEHGAFDDTGKRVGDYWQQTDNGIVPRWDKS